MIWFSLQDIIQDVGSFQWPWKMYGLFQRGSFLVLLREDQTFAGVNTLAPRQSDHSPPGNISPSEEDPDVPEVMDCCCRLYNTALAWCEIWNTGAHCHPAGLRQLLASLAIP